MKFVVCIRNDGYSASLELFKIYRLIPDARAEKHGMLRVIDDSGEDYLYIPIELPEAVERAIESAVASAA